MPELANRDQLDAQVSAALLLLFDDERQRLADLVGDPPDLRKVPPLYWHDVGKRLQRELTDALTPAYAQAAEAQAARLGLEWTPEQIARDAAAWLLLRSSELVDLFIENTKQALSKLAQQAHTEDAAAWTAGLVMVFGETRAEAMAVTSVTEANTRGERDVVRRYELVTGSTVIAIWNTEHDDRVCPICEPLDDQPEEVWQDDFPGGPPAHPNCRCTLSYEVTGDDVFSEN